MKGLGKTFTKNTTYKPTDVIQTQTVRAQISLKTIV